MLTNTHGWSHTRGNAVVPSHWQATMPKDAWTTFCKYSSHSRISDAVAKGFGQGGLQPNLTSGREAKRSQDRTDF